jgi:hypothetical protein
MTLFKTVSITPAVQAMDRLRHDLMRALLDSTGHLGVWMYSVRDAQQAFQHAWRTREVEGMREWRPEYTYAFVGPKVQNIYFDTPRDLGNIVVWVCGSEGPMLNHAAFSKRDPWFRMDKEEAKQVALRIVVAHMTEVGLGNTNPHATD